MMCAQTTFGGQPQLLRQLIDQADLSGRRKVREIDRHMEPCFLARLRDERRWRNGHAACACDLERLAGRRKFLDNERELCGKAVPTSNFE